MTQGTHGTVWQGITFAGKRGGGVGSFDLLPLTLCMTADFCHPLVMAVHAVNAVTGLGKDELVDSVAADLALEAVGMIRVVSSHDRLVENGLLADVAVVAAFCTDGGAV